MTDQSLSATEIEDYRTLAGMIVPASEKYKVPGADDPAIFADIVKSIGRDFADIRAGLALAKGVTGLDPAAREALGAKLRAEGGNPIAVLTRLVLLCYYRDDRVMISLGLEPRPPFPKGHVLEQGDWSLLDPVKARAPFWRKA